MSAISNVASGLSVLGLWVLHISRSKLSSDVSSARNLGATPVSLQNDMVFWALLDFLNSPLQGDATVDGTGCHTNIEETVVGII